MSSVFTRRLAQAHPTAAGFFPVFTNNGPDIIIVRSIELTPLGSVAQLAGVYIQGPGDFYWLLLDASAVPGKTIHVDTRQQVLLGEQLFVQCGSSGCTLLITGYTLSSV